MKLLVELAIRLGGFAVMICAATLLMVLGHNGIEWTDGREFEFLTVLLGMLSFVSFVVGLFGWIGAVAFLLNPHPIID